MFNKAALASVAPFLVLVRLSVLFMYILTGHNVVIRKNTVMLIK